MTVSRTGIISTGKMELKQKTVEKKKKKKAIRRAFYVQIWMVVCGSAVAIATHVSPLLLHARILSSCLALIHSFSPATIHFLKRKKPEQKDKIDDIRPCLCSCLQFSASFFFGHSMDPSNGRFMLMHLRPSRVGTRMHCLVARSLHIVDSTITARHWNGKL